jgi:ABC-type transport system involved in multi-copper enzyme maturation permease subunit
MPLDLGPVFERERLVAARGRRFYALRSAYGLGLLAVIVATGRTAKSPLEFGTIAGVRTAASLFQNLLLAQGLAVVLLTPALVAGAVAQEYQRRTLHELLSSNLTSAEIVLGKLAARLSLVAVLAATGLPLSLATGLLGGVELPLVLGSLAATLSTALFLGSLSILASTQTRSVRGAMNLTFTLVLSWLILPAAIDVLLPRGGELGRTFYRGLGPVNAWVAATSPFSLWIDVMRGAIVGAPALRSRVVWMIALQTIYGAMASALAVGCLRPSFRARVGGPVRRRIGAAGRKASAAGSEARPQSRRRRPCGDDPMIWKELMPRSSVFGRPSVVGVVLILGGLLVASTTALATPALGELFRDGYGVAPAGSARVLFHSYLRIVGTGIALVYLLGIASDAAGSLTSERENETWISLITTPLTGTEIIRAKLLGAIWEIRHTAVVLTAIWLLGVLVGSVHPLGLVAALAELAAYAALAAALGTWISLRARHTMQAMAHVMASLLLLSGGSLLVALPILGLRPLALTACGPLLLAFTLASHGDLAGKPAAGSFGPMPDWMLGAVWDGNGPEMTLTCLASVLGAAVCAWALIRSACRGFDACLDRPSLAGPEAVVAGVSSSGVPSRPRTRLRSSQRASPPIAPVP